MRLIEHMMAKGDVWFATCAEIAEHVAGLIARNEWTPPEETLPFYDAAVPQIVHPSR